MWRIVDFIARVFAFLLLIYVGWRVSLFSDNLGGLIIFLFFVLMAGKIMKMDKKEC